MDVEKRETAGLAELANEINAEHRAFVGSLQKTAEHGIRCGELLAQAKAECPHGTWLDWLGQNFEGSVRTAQGYMRLYANRDSLLANTQPVAHLGIAGALKELAEPSEPPASPSLGEEEPGGPPWDAQMGTERLWQEMGKELEEQDDAEYPVEYVRDMLDLHGPTKLGGEVLKGIEERLSNPRTREWKLVHDLNLETLKLFGLQVQVDGFLLEPAENYPPLPSKMQEEHGPGNLVLSWRPPDKKKLYAVPVPIRDATFLEEHADRIKRGCEQYALYEFKVWRLLANWVTEEVLAAFSSDLDEIRRRVAHNTDWRNAEPIADYLYDKAYNRGDERRRAAECGVSLKEFQDMVGGVKAWIAIAAYQMRKSIIAPELHEKKSAGR